MNLYAIECKDRLSPILYNDLINLIDKRYKEKCSKFFHWQDSQRTLFGRLLARYGISKACAIENSTITFYNNNYGKPLIKHHKNIYFNISHSKNWVVCAISTCHIGIDVQAIEHIKLSIADRFFTQEENDYIMTLKEEEQIHGFYDIWTLKESYIKALGTGLTLPLNTFSIVKSDNNIKLINGKYKDFFFKQYNLAPEYKLSVCSKKNNFCDNIKHVTIDGIIKQLC